MNRLRWFWRWPIKAAVLGLTVLAVCFPSPRLLIRHLRHIANPNAMIDPNEPRLAPLAEELSGHLTDQPTPKEILRRVEKLVSQRIRYDWDWNTWGTADYLPTVEEVMERGMEDCDGRAVVAASLLRRLGFKANLANDFAHMWVTTEYGDTMSPNETAAVVSGEDGIRVQLSAITELPRAAAFGIAVFPLGREMIVLLVWWILLWNGGGWRRPVAGFAFLAGGLILLRFASGDYHAPVIGLQFTAILSLFLGVAVLMVRTSAATRSAASPRPGSAAVSR